MRPKLTKTQIDDAIAAGVPAGKAHVMLWDEVAGFGLKMRPTSAAWVFVYRPSGLGRLAASRTMTLGRYPALSVDDARKAARSAAGRVAMGDDPAKVASEKKKRERWTVAAACDAYEIELRRLKFVKTSDRMSSLRRGLSKHMNKELASLTRADIMDALSEREAAGLTSADLRKGVNGLLNFMIERGRLQFNVMAGVVRGKKTRHEIIASGEEVGRALNDEEIVKIWGACANAGSFGNLVRMALLTGCRRVELAKLRWSDIGDEVITIQAIVAKTARKHEVPLTPLMRQIIEAQRAVRGTAQDDTLVFPSVDGNDVVIAGWSKLVPKLRRLAGVGVAVKDGSTPKDHWTLHDCRRTVRTIMSRRGVHNDIAELAIGHVTAALIRAYNKDDRDNARRDAFERVSTHISLLLQGDDADNIVSIKRQNRR
jgi:integrase